MAIRGVLTTKFGEERECYIRINNVENSSNHNVKWKPRLRGYLVDFTVDESPVYVWDSVEEGLKIECDVDLNIQESCWSQMYKQIMDNQEFNSIVKNIVVID